MRKRRLFFIVGMLVAAVMFAFAGCGSRTVQYTLSDTEIELTVNEKKTLTLTPATEKSVTWVSADPEVATVQNGEVTAVKVGDTTVTATVEDGEKPLVCKVTVKAPQPATDKGYKLDFTSVSLKTGETKQIGVLTKEDAPATGVTYTSADPQVATVSGSGLITAVKKGETNITASVDGSELICKVTVEQGYTYSLDKTQLQIAAGGSGRITLITTPDDGESARPHTFSSLNPEIATVNGGTGKVTGVKKGTATIVCSVDGKELKATVSVTEYTVKIGEELLTAETTLRVGNERQLTVTADPAGEFTPVYDSADKTVVSVSDTGKLTALKEGSTSVTVTVGGRTFTTAVTVNPAVMYEINSKKVDLTLGKTFAIQVTRDPAGDFAATYESSATNVATVDNNGVITAAGLGTATITTSITGTDVTFETEVSVVLETSLAHEDYTFGSGAVNLTYLDNNKTIDWRWYYNSDGLPTRMKDNANLIGDYNMIGCDDERFWDYKAPVMFEDAEGDKSGAYTYGRAVHGSYTISVKVTNQVSKIVIFTGSWKEEATIEFKLGDTVLQSERFAGGENALARKYVLTLDTSALQDGQSLDLTIAVNCNRANGGNVSLVAVAAIGNVPHGFTKTAATTANVTTGLTGAQDLTAAGGIDWVSANGAKKAGVPANAVINAGGIVYDPAETVNDKGEKTTYPGSASDYPGASITWTDGTKAAPANLKQFLWAPDSVTIPVLLEKGKTTVTVYATGWNSGYFVAVYDKNGNFINGYQGADEKSNASVSSKIAVTVDANEAGMYAFKIMKCRGSGNVGWAAVAVNGANEVEPQTTVYDLKKTETAKISLDGATYVSNDPAVATVETDGTVRAVGAGTTFITATYNNVTRKIFVTVTEYTITSAATVDLFVGGTANITIASNPAGHAIDATYESSAEEVVTVSADGAITAVKPGSATITVKVGGTLVGTVTVTVANYSLNKTSHTIVTASGTNTFTLQVLNGETPLDPATLTFESSDETVATVSAAGVVEAVGIGKVTVTAKTQDGTVLECEIEAVVLPVTTQPTEYADGEEYSVNLTTLDETNKTLDWHYFGNNMTERMQGGSLIGELQGERTNFFYDYRVKMYWSDGTDRDANIIGLTDGWTFNGSVSFNVTLTDKTEYIAIFTGAWHAKNTIEVKIDGKTHAVYEFANCGNSDRENKNKQLRIYPDVSEMTESTIVTVTLTCGAEPDHGWSDNISLVAIAVVGTETRTETPVPVSTATAEITPLMPEADATLDITQVGTLDWMYVKNGNDGGIVRKAGIPTDYLIKANDIKCYGGDGYDWFGNKKQYFTWTDGTEAVHDGKVNNFRWINDRYYIPVRLPKGESEVTLYLSGWKCSYFVTVLDAYGKTIIDAERIVTGDGANSQAATVKVTVNAAETRTFTFLLTREGDGNHGYAAIAVAQKTNYSLSANIVNAVIGAAAPAKLSVLKDGAATEDAVTWTSANTDIVTVAADGTLTLKGAGKTVVTASVGGIELFVFVNVTEYTLESTDDVTLPLQGTSQIEISADPHKDFTVNYSSSDDAVATVGESGLITAVASGTATVTATVDGKSFEITVHVVKYKLNKSEIVLKAGKDIAETDTLKALDEADAEMTGFTFTSENKAIATVDANTGVVTAVGVGETTITATGANGVALVCKVVVTLPDTEAVYTELDYGFENLSRVSPTYKTIDYKHWSNEDTVTMNGGFVGEPSSTNGDFWDYKTTIGYGYQEGGRNLGKTYGKTSKGFELPVKIDNTVSEVVFYTGAYKATATVAFKIGERVLATKTFEAADVGVARKIAVALDTSKMTGNLTLKIVGSLANPDDDNINVVAVAVVGTTPYSENEIASATATVESRQVEGDKGSNKVNLTETGTLDWKYSHYENPNDKTYEKFGGTVLTGETYYNEKGETAGAGAQWDGFSAFCWTDGILDGSDATEGSSNPADSNETWADSNQYTNNYNAVAGEIHIGMNLATGKYVITVYLNSWQAVMSAALYDGNDNFIAGKLVRGDEGGVGKGYVVTFTVDVKTAGEFKLVIGKSRSHGASDRQVGWQAVTVAQAPQATEE